MSSLHASSVYGCICAANRMGNTDDDDTDDDGYSDTTMSTHTHTQNGQLLSLLPTHISFMSRMYALDIITPCTSPSSSLSLPLLPKQNPYAPLLLASSLSCSLLALIEVILADSSLPPYTFLSSSSISAVSRSEFISAAARSGILATSAPRRSTLGAMTHTHTTLSRAPALLFFQRLFFTKTSNRIIGQKVRHHMQARSLLLF